MPTKSRGWWRWIVVLLALGQIGAACGGAPAGSPTPTGLSSGRAASTVATGASSVAVPDGTATARGEARQATVTPSAAAGPSAGRARPASGRVDRDVVYCRPNGVAVKADIYYPANPRTPAPAAMYVHGGAWVGGDKGSGAGILALPELIGRGYVVVSIDYRLAPEYGFPAQIEDAKCAVRFLRANAARYGIDVERIGVWGGSAGGHLVSLLGLTDASAGFDGNGGYAEQSSRVRAVVDMFGPSDLPRLLAGPGAAQTRQQVFGVTDPASPILQRASPVSYVAKSAPPFLILQGDKDTTVPAAQSEELYEKLTAAGAAATLVIVKNAGHGFIPAGGPISPSREEIARLVADFFDRCLRGG